MVLVNSVLANLLLYFFSIFRAPKWVTNRIEALKRAFFWRGGGSVVGDHYLVWWKEICRSRKEGGLGVLDINNMNLSLLAKWWWMFFTDRNHLWGPLVKDIYYTRWILLKEGVSFRPHLVWWRSVLKSREIFKCKVSYSVGNGQIIMLWMNIWNDHATLRALFPRIYDTAVRKNLRVVESWGRNGWNLCKILLGTSPSIQQDRDLIWKFKETISELVIANRKDSVK